MHITGEKEGPPVKVSSEAVPGANPRSALLSLTSSRATTRPRASSRRC
jgi:hypothetical protein